MTPEQQRIKIAEVCGWKWTTNPFPNKEHRYRWQRGTISFGPWYPEHFNKEHTLATVGLPNYPEDLNAMHEAEKVLMLDQAIDYINQLYHITFKAGRDRDYGVVFATSQQRSEAFLRTLGLWED